MFTVTTYVIFWTLVFFLLGVVWYVLDRMYGVKLYPHVYKWGHEKPLPDGSDIGFIYNQRTRVQVAAAAFVSTAQTLMTLSTEINPLAEFIMWIVEVPITLIGFMCGPLAYRFWKERYGWFDVLDRVRGGEIDVRKKVVSLGNDVSHGISASTQETTSRTKSLLANLWDRSFGRIFRGTVPQSYEQKDQEEVK